MRQRHLAPLAAALLAAIGAPRPATGQTPPESIPAQLVAALLDDQMALLSTSREFAVAQLPRGYPQKLVPTGPIKVVGGMTTRDEIVAVFSDSTRRLAAVFEQLFEQAGYSRPSPTPGSGFSLGAGPYTYFCGDSGTLSVEPLAGMNRTFARVTFRPMRDRSSCQPPAASVQQHQLTLPPLTPPPGADVRRSGGSGGTDGVGSNAEVTGANLVPSAIVAYYAAQLVAAGWTAETPAVSDRVAAQYLEAKDSTGTSWEGVLMASGGRGMLNLSLNMHPRDSR